MLKVLRARVSLGRRVNGHKQVTLSWREYCWIVIFLFWDQVWLRFRMSLFNWCLRNLKPMILLLEETLAYFSMKAWTFFIKTLRWARIMTDMHFWSRFNLKILRYSALQQRLNKSLQALLWSKIKKNSLRASSNFSWRKSQQTVWYQVFHKTIYVIILTTFLQLWSPRANQSRMLQLRLIWLSLNLFLFFLSPLLSIVQITRPKQTSNLRLTLKMSLIFSKPWRV
jgi:hypothetical protein